MSKVTVNASVTKVSVSPSRTSVVLREVPVRDVHYFISPWQTVKQTEEVKASG